MIKNKIFWLLCCAIIIALTISIFRKTNMNLKLNENVSFVYKDVERIEELREEFIEEILQKNKEKENILGLYSTLCSDKFIVVNDSLLIPEHSKKNVLHSVGNEVVISPSSLSYSADRKNPFHIRQTFYNAEQLLRLKIIFAFDELSSSTDKINGVIYLRNLEGKEVRIDTLHINDYVDLDRVYPRTHMSPPK